MDHFHLQVCKIFIFTNRNSIESHRHKADKPYTCIGAGACFLHLSPVLLSLSVFTFTLDLSFDCSHNFVTCAKMWTIIRTGLKSRPYCFVSTDIEQNQLKYADFMQHYFLQLPWPQRVQVHFSCGASGDVLLWFLPKFSLRASSNQTEAIRWSWLLGRASLVWMESKVTDDIFSCNKHSIDALHQHCTPERNYWCHGLHSSWKCKN